MYRLHPRRTGETFFKTAARNAYHSVRGLYRKARAAKNLFLNLIDKPIIILLYHRVSDLPDDPEMLAVSPENFQRQMEFLKQQCQIVRFDEDWSHANKPAVAVTFDDGYADNALAALPILEEVGIPATFFISSGSIGTDRVFWWNRLEVLLQDGNFPFRFTLDDARYGRTWATGTSEQRNELYSTLIMLMKKVGSDRHEAWLNQLEQWSGSTQTKKNTHRPMTLDELKRLAASPWVTIGAHTVSHSALSALAEEQQREEIFSSKQNLEDLTGLKITTFSYPFGRKQDYDQISVRLCREAGFIKTAANFPGQVHKWTDPFQLPRHLVRNWDLDTFAAQMKSFWTR